MKSALMVVMALLVVSAVAVEPSWKLTLQRENTVDGFMTISSEGQTAVRTTAPSGAERYVYETITDGRTTYKVRLMIDLERTPGGLKLNGSVANSEEGWLVTALEGPVIGAFPARPFATRIYLPYGTGQRINSVPSGVGLKTSRWNEDMANGSVYSFRTERYPGHFMTMSYMALDSDDGEYAYVGYHDRQHRAMHFKVVYTIEKHLIDVWPVSEFFVHSGETYALGEMEFLRGKGDWHRAARHYRAKYEELHGKDFIAFNRAPRWVRGISGWLLTILKQQNGEIIYPYGDIDKVCDYAEKTGMNLVSFYGWTVGGHDHLYPEYVPCPEMGGEEGLRKAIETIHKRGLKTYIYLNGQLMQKDATRFWEEKGKDIAILNRDGTNYTQHHHKYFERDPYSFPLACLHSRAWRDHMLGLAKYIHSLGADGVMYDQIGNNCPIACYDPRHGHPVPAFTFESERPSYLKEIADAMKKIDPNFIVLSEGITDTLFDSVEFFHACAPGTSHVNPGDFAKRGVAYEDVFPEMLRYTFPEYVISDREATPIKDRTMSNFAVAFGFRHDIEIRYGYDRVYCDTGKLPTAADYKGISAPSNIEKMNRGSYEEQTSYLRKINEFQRKFGEYLLYGKFVDSDGFNVTSDGLGELVVNRWLGEKGGSAVLVWNAGSKPQRVVISGLGDVVAADDPENGPVSPSSLVPPESIRLYRFGR